MNETTPIGTCKFCGVQVMGKTDKEATAECDCDAAVAENAKCENYKRIDYALERIQAMCSIDSDNMLLGLVRDAAMLTMYQSIDKAMFQFGHNKVAISMNAKEKIIFAITESTGLKFEV
ncbi:MAG: hypothetical protein R3Y18_00110 [Bacillota bacterium]